MPEEYDLNKLQEDAARRMREMQARARFPQGRPQQPRPSAQERSRPQGQRPAPHQAPEAPPPEPEPAEPQDPPAQEVSGTEPAPAKGGLLENLFQDKERTIILALLILLSGEESNHELMFALLFLLM